MTNTIKQKTAHEINTINEELLDFIEQCPTAFHTADTIRKILADNGYRELHESAEWDLREGGRYYVIRGGSSILAFRIPAARPAGFMIAASHTDSPALKIKVNPEIRAEGCIRLNVEKYGGALLQSWFDRPLSVAGRVIVRTGKGLESRLIDIDRDLVVIPHLAIHMDKTLNDGQKLSVQNDLLPLWGQEESAVPFLSMMAEEAGCLPEDLLGFDLYLYARGRGSIWGAGGEFISARHLDDLQCGFADLKGFLSAQEYDPADKGQDIRVSGGEGPSSRKDSVRKSAAIPVLAVFDSEEVGSRTMQGADSTFLSDIVARIGSALSWSREQTLAAEANSFMISADNAHAVHPGHAGKADPVNRPQMNKGIVLKYGIAQKYMTDGLSAAVFKEICHRAGVPYQEFTNRSDTVGGSTLGNISISHLSIPTADIGLPQLSMHSCYETAGTLDTAYLVRAMEVFFSGAVRNEGGGLYRFE